MQDEGCTVGTPHYGATHFVCYRKQQRLCLRCFPNYLDPHFQGGRLLWSRLSRMAEAGGQRHLCFGWGGFISRESQGNIFTLAAINALIKKTTSSPYSEGYLSKYIQREWEWCYELRLLPLHLYSCSSGASVKAFTNSLFPQGIEIHNNPWLCDCRLLEFSRYALRDQR